MHKKFQNSVTDVVTVTEALVLHPILEDRGHITESICILVPIDRMKQKCFQITTKRVRRSQQFQSEQWIVSDLCVTGLLALLFRIKR